MNCLLTNVGGLLNGLLGLSSVSIASTTDYLHLQGKALAEIKLTGSSTTVTYLHPDLLGSPRMATNSSGQTLWQEHYDPYGKKLNNVQEKLGYTGHAYDSESGLTYAQARFYDAQVGRFLSADPIHFTGNPFTFNRYAYGNGNPYRYTDPTGMAGCETQTTGTNICGGSTSSPVSSSPGAMHGAGAARKEMATVSPPQRLQDRANTLAAEISNRGYFTSKGEADWLYQINSDPSLGVTVDAAHLTATATGEWVSDSKGGARAPGYITGDDYAVHGQVTLRLRPNDTYGVFDQRYDYELHSDFTIKGFARNAGVIMGEPPRGFFPNTPYWIHYYGNVNVTNPFGGN